MWSSTISVADANLGHCGCMTLPAKTSISVATRHMIRKAVRSEWHRIGRAGMCRSTIEDSCHYYLEELHFDGLRFDFTSQIVNKNGNAGNDSGAEVLHRIIKGLKGSHPDRVLMCEHWDVTDNAYKSWMITYIGFDAGWFNFRENLQNALTPYAQGVESQLAQGINGGEYPTAHSRVIYANNHDECWWDGNSPPSKFWPVSQFGGRDDYWAKKKARMICALSFFVPASRCFSWLTSSRWRAVSTTTALILSQTGRFRQMRWVVNSKPCTEV